MPIKIVKDKRTDKIKHLYALHKLAKEARRKINEERDGFTIVSGSFKLTFGTSSETEAR